MYINADYVHKGPPQPAWLGETRRPKGLLDPRLDEAGWMGGAPPTLIHLWTPPPLVVATRRCAFRDASQYFGTTTKNQVSRTKYKNQRTKNRVYAHNGTAGPSASAIRLADPREVAHANEAQSGSQ